MRKLISMVLLLLYVLISSNVFAQEKIVPVDDFFSECYKYLQDFNLDKKEHPLIKGQTIRLVFHNMIILGTTKEYYKSFLRIISGYDDIPGKKIKEGTLLWGGVALMVGEKKLLVVDNRTPAKILIGPILIKTKRDDNGATLKTNIIKVSILRGKHRGRVGWVSTAFIK